MVIVEDIVDTGLTLAYLSGQLRARGPRTLVPVGPEATAAEAVELMQASGQWSRHREPNVPPFELYQWQHVAFTVDGPSVRLYRQGREVASGKFAGLKYPVPKTRRIRPLVNAQLLYSDNPG